MVEDAGPALVARSVTKRFKSAAGPDVQALDDVSFSVPAGAMTALVGPDGAGKTTFLRLAAGLLKAEAGTVSVLGLDPARDPAAVQAAVAYMPQRFGLYEDLSVAANLDLYADLQGVVGAPRLRRIGELLELTTLAPFAKRLAGQLSGGMKQKLGLACTLIHEPELLLLDEPTVGVDPLSRRELWGLIEDLVEARQLTVLLSTAHLDEADRCAHAVVLHRGRRLAEDLPASIRRRAQGRVFLAEPGKGLARALQARLLDSPAVADAVPEGGAVRFIAAENGGGAAAPEGSVAEIVVEAGAAGVQPAPPRFEDGFMVLLRQADDAAQASRPIVYERPPAARAGARVVEVQGLVRRFGAFTAVDHIDFDVRAGEIFGLLGPNGAGKTTTFRMLCGLLPASGGTLRIAGVDLRAAPAAARRGLGYVAQKFALYGDLSVKENLEFFAGAYGLSGEAARRRIAWALEQFELGPYRTAAADQLPGGFKRRLAMAAALMHEPDILFLDEPTSGADPLARRDFWRSITALAEQGVTIIVTTHFMEEAEYCDRVAILDRGQIIAAGAPADIRKAGSGAHASMEDAFLAIVERGRSDPGAHRKAGAEAGR
jgi:ABC-2 type transport system ATP-binding protein